ncbi:MAG: xanthine dehydrogenase family protein subunit M [Anaerolineaceae bacterium]|nr:xanthine dehydrogenase family protein subunit M [Anaerolineaceae bacterium]
MTKYSILTPTGLDEALELLEKHSGNIKPLAGGTDLLIDFRYGKPAPEFLLDITCIPELNRVKVNGDIRIGPATNLTDVSQSNEIKSWYAMLAEGAGCVGSYQIRNLATIGGNICNAVPSADTAPPLLAADASVKMRSKAGERTMPVAAFFLGPRKNALQPGELVTEIELPTLKERTGSIYKRYTHRKALDLAVVGVAVQLTLTPSLEIENVAVALGAVAPVPLRVEAAEKLLVGNPYSEELAEEAAELAKKFAKPISDVRSSAEYRQKIVRVFVKRSIAEAHQRAISARSGE